jgi:hypothetical protein
LLTLGESVDIATTLMQAFGFKLGEDLTGGAGTGSKSRQEGTVRDAPVDSGALERYPAYCRHEARS